MSDVLPEVDLDRLVAESLEEVGENSARRLLRFVEQAGLDGLFDQDLLGCQPGGPFEVWVSLSEDSRVAVVHVRCLVVDSHVGDGGKRQRHADDAGIRIGSDVSVSDLGQVDAGADLGHRQHGDLITGRPVEPATIGALLDGGGGHRSHGGELGQLLNLLDSDRPDSLDRLFRDDRVGGVDGPTDQERPEDQRTQDCGADEGQDHDDPWIRAAARSIRHPTRLPPGSVLAVETQMVRVNEIELFVRTYGPDDGYPIILLHGWPDSGRGWSRVAPLLEDGFRVVVPDNRGFGRSDMPEGTDSYRMHVLLADLAGLIAWTGAPTVSVVGHDFGAAIAWQAATFLMDVVDRVVCVAAPHPMRMREFAGFTRQLTRSFYVWLLNSGASGEALLSHGEFVPLSNWVFGEAVDEVEKREYRREWSEPGRFTAMAEWYRASFRPELFNPDVVLQLPNAQVPVRYIHGSRDWAFVEEMAVGSGKFVNAEFDEVELDAGHWIPLEHAPALAASIVDWVDRR